MRQVLGQLHTGALELAGKALQLALKPLEQREGVGGGAGEAGQHGAARADPAHLAGVALDDVAQQGARHPGRPSPDAVATNAPGWYRPGGVRIGET